MDKVLVFLLGLFLGSFGGMLSFRLPEREPLSGRSKCPKCGKVLGPFELVPVLSYLFQKGKCAGCGKKISLAYPVVELLTAGSFLLFYTHFGLAAEGLFHLVVAFHLCILAGTDIAHGLLPDTILASCGTFAVMLRITQGLGTGLGKTLLHGVWGACLGFGFLYLVAFVKPGAMGGGDVKMAGVIGLYLGFAKVMPALGLGFILSSLYCVPLLLLGKLKRTDTMPLGVFLSVATLIMAVVTWPPF